MADRDRRMLAAIRQVLDDDERITARGRCWAAVRRRHVPLLVLGRRRHDAVLTDRRLILVVRHRRRLRPADVVLVKRFEALTLVEQHRRPTLLQQQVRTDADTCVVVEWPRGSRDLGRALSEALGARGPREAA